MNKPMFQISVPVTVLREGDAFVAYTPALDLSTVGASLEEAQKNFTEAVNLFLEESWSMGTLDEVLADLGWHKKDDHEWIPPVVVAHQSQNFTIPLK